MQLLYIGMIWWTSIKGGSKGVGRLAVEESVAARAIFPRGCNLVNGIEFRRTGVTLTRPSA
jgi:hypothetical protein